MTVNAGDLVYLKAGSGVGKTTVVKILMGLQRADYFRMTFDGVRLGEVSPARYWRKNLWGKKITMAFQHADEALNPRSTVEESLSILPAGAGSSPGAEAGILARLFEEEEIPSLLTKKVWQLSGGQKQRLNLLRAFALSTPLLILDEPLSALDFGSIEGVLALMQASRRQGQAILLISHNEDIFDPVVPPDSVYQLVASGG
jgi:ABC-type dipeptide/oligopeptide/nickel transport system ATPase subunit